MPICPPHTHTCLPPAPAQAIPAPEQQFGVAVVAGACQLNIGLLAFNLLLPAYPLDGGRILADLLLICRVPVAAAAKITAAVATLLGAGVLAFGIWRTLETSGEPERRRVRGEGCGGGEACRLPACLSARPRH